MIERLIRIEAASLRRSFVVWLAVLLVVGGSVVARMVTWISHALGRTELRGLPFVNADLGWSDVAVPLALLAYLIVTSYVFGRDFEDGNVDLILTAPVRRDAVVFARMIVITAAMIVLSLMAWGADLATSAVLATSSFGPGPATSATAALGSAVAALATLPFVAWAAVRFRGVLPALGFGIGIQVIVLILGGIALVQSLPWFLPTTVAAGESLSWFSVGLSVLLFTGGLVATLRGLRTVDLFE